MALQSIKSIIENKGYLIEQKDRAIFEMGDLSSFFGFSENDAIEFIIYDSNDNQLPQINGELVRYIPLSTNNIGDYFLIPTGTVFQKYQLPNEYFIDAERLLREAGYNNGIFKTQITLVNKRVGNETPFNKMWISEISPSRTEVRLFPLIKNQPKELLDSLKERFNTFVRNKKFREDYINQAFKYIEKINPSEVGIFLKSKYGDAFFNSMVNEYKIQSFDVFVNNIYQHFMEACVYEFTNRISNISDVNYGKPKNKKPPVSITDSELKSTIQGILIRILNKYLPSPDVREVTAFDVVTEESMDEVSQILQKTESDLQIDANVPKDTAAITTKKSTGNGIAEKVGIITKPISKKTLELDKKIEEQVGTGFGLIRKKLKQPVDETPIVDEIRQISEIKTDDLQIQSDVIVKPMNPNNTFISSPEEVISDVQIKPLGFVTKNESDEIFADEKSVTGLNFGKLIRTKRNKAIE